MRAVKTQRAIPGGAVPAGTGWPRAGVTAAAPRMLRTVTRPPRAWAGATAAQLRQYINGLTDFAGVDGSYNFTKYPQRGLGPEASTVTTYDAKNDSWVWLSQPGGEPLSQ